MTSSPCDPVRDRLAVEAAPMGCRRVARSLSSPGFGSNGGANETPNVPMDPPRPIPVRPAVVAAAGP